MSSVLTLADESANAAAAKSGGSDGQGERLRLLARSPLARAELLANKKTWRRMDHVHLTQYDNTNFCQWVGRCADGFHRPIGRIMQIVETKEPSR